ncbi:MAG: energy transducer TonB [Pseudomonadales bacterium]
MTQAAIAPTQAPSSPKVSSIDRLCFTLFIAAALHLTLIVGIGFDVYHGNQASPSIEVTISRTPSEIAPDEADYMAADNQLGGGLLADAALPSVTQLSEHVSQETTNTTPEAPPPSQSEQQQQQTAVITTQKEAELSALSLSKSASQQEKLAQLEEKISLQEQSMGLVSRDAELNIFDQLLTKERTLKVNSLATLKTRDAYYVKQWIDKIERVGRLNYPNEALRKNIEGKLSLQVILLADGTIRELKVISSSGHQVLDDAAINIVRRAGHFAPFSSEMKKHYDQLEITRVWQFTKDNKSLNLSGTRL